MPLIYQSKRERSPSSRSGFHVSQVVGRLGGSLHATLMCIVPMTAQKTTAATLAMLTDRRN
jgi:hypothetical protein